MGRIREALVGRAVDVETRLPARIGIGYDPGGPGSQVSQVGRPAEEHSGDQEEEQQRPENNSCRNGGRAPKVAPDTARTEYQGPEMKDYERGRQRRDELDYGRQGQRHSPEKSITPARARDSEPVAQHQGKQQGNAELSAL